MSRPKRILFVGLQNSIHVARWIDLIADEGWDLHMFPVNDEEPSTKLRGTRLHLPRASADVEALARIPREPFAVWAWRRVTSDPVSILQEISRRLCLPWVWAATRARLRARSLRRAWRRYRASTLPLVLDPFYPSVEELGGRDAIRHGRIRLGESDNCAPVLHGPGVLASLVRRIEPDLIHSMEYQHAGYLVLRAKDLYGPGFPPWLATNWGSDIYLYQHFADHRAQLERLLKSIDFYSCECRRDIGLARALGFEGEVMPVLPNSGGFDLRRLVRLRSKAPPSRRRIVMMKGYEHFAGRALRGLDVLESLSTELEGFKIVLFSVSAEPRARALALRASGKLDISVIDYAPHEEILRMFGRARMYLGISISDGVSTSMLEAMVMGAFPIQTNTSCCDEWYADGEGGFIIPHDDPDVIRDRVRRALHDDDLVDRAAEINLRTAKEKLDRDVVAPKVRDFYRRMDVWAETSGGGDVRCAP